MVAIMVDNFLDMNPMIQNPTTQVSFRLNTDVYNKFSAKIKELGISKQSFYERAIALLISGLFPFDSDGSDKVAVGSKDIEQVVKDNFHLLAEMVVNDSDFLLLVTDKIASTLVLQDKVKDNSEVIESIAEITENNSEVIEDKVKDNELKVMESVDTELVNDKDTEDKEEIITDSQLGDFAVSQVFIDKLSTLPYKFNTQRDLEIALGIPD